MSLIINYGRQSIDDDDIQAVVDTLKSDYLTQGPNISTLEARIRELTGASFCVVVSNATAALHIAVAALSIPEGSEGITSPNTFVASANCLAYNRIKPIFADIDAKTYCIDIQEIEKKINKKTKVIVPVDFAGQPAAMDKIWSLAKKHKLFIIEDASHAIGTFYSNGKPVGSCVYSDMTVFSFHPVKTITTGEGGAITTNNEAFYQKLLLLRSHGITKDPNLLTKNPGPWYYEMHTLGFNYRLTDIQAALGISQLKKLNQFKLRRKEIINRYNNAFLDLKTITTPFESAGFDNCFHLYVIKIDFNFLDKSKRKVMEELLDLGVGTQVHYIPIHLQPYYKKKYGYMKGDYPIAESYYESALSIPLYPAMTDSDIDTVIHAITKVCS